RAFRKLKFKIPMYKNVELDKYGSYIFLQVDGERTVEEIGKNLELKYGEESHPLYERLLLFLNHIEVNCNYIEKIIK
ncbi:PqqD family peptide modification chaperone, partial [Enterococcus sp.]|uniref:PqqD family peptide modification chaperone n=1 Tax=Enterococcus sp. TaxID=35783 RepID=UPI002FC68862